MKIVLQINKETGIPYFTIDASDGDFEDFIDAVMELSMNLDHLLSAIREETQAEIVRLTCGNTKEKMDYGTEHHR